MFKTPFQAESTTRPEIPGATPKNQQRTRWPLGQRRPVALHIQQPVERETEGSRDRRQAERTWAFSPPLLQLPDHSKRDPCSTGKILLPQAGGEPRLPDY